MSLASPSPRSSTTGTRSRSSTRPATRTSWPRSSQGFAGRGRRALRAWTPRAASRPASRRPSRSAARTGTAALFVINKCDRENADPAAALDALRAAFGNKIAPLQLAIGAAETFTGYVDLVHRKAYRWDGRQEVEIPIPAELAAEVARRRDQLLEAAAEADDDVLTKYLEGEEITDAELEACLHKGVRDSVLAPVLVGSAAKGIGLRGLLDAIVRYLPSPAEEPPADARDRQGRRRRRRSRRTPDGPLLVRVFKTTADPFVGRLTYLRVLSGTLQQPGPRLERRRGARTSASASSSSSTARSRSRSASSRPARSAPSPS